MGRKNIFETSADSYNDAGTELKKIAILFHSELFSKRELVGARELLTGYDFRAPNNATIEEIVDNYTFCDWKSRCAYLDCRDMRNTLGLVECPPEEADALLILKYLEYYINIWTLASRANCDSTYQRSNKFNMLIVNIRKLIDYLNHEERRIESEDKILVIPKNPAGTAAAEISPQQIGVAILKYHHHLLKGDVDEKRKLLNMKKY